MFTVTFLLSFTVLALWSMANPMFGAPDEGRHIARSEAIMRGNSGSETKTRIPINAGYCFNHKPEVTADCMDLAYVDEALPASDIPGSYPPLAHVIYGIPTTFLSGIKELYAARLFGDAFLALCIAGSAQLLRTRWRRSTVITSIVVALTPQAIFLGSSINPSGIAAGLSLLLVSSLVANRPQDDQTTQVNPRWARFALVLALTLYPLVRRDSVIWGLLIIGLFAIVIGSRTTFTMLRLRFVQVGIALFTVSAVLTRMIFTKGSDSDMVTSVSESYSHGSLIAVKALWNYFREVIGVFGALDTPLPLELATIGFVVIGTVLLVSLAGSRSWPRLGLVVGVLLLFVLPVAFGYQRYPYFQGRYLLPLEIAVVIIACSTVVSFVADQRFSRSLLRLLATIMVVLQFFAFAHNLRRYAVGPAGSWFPGSESVWQPPWLSVQVFDLLFAILSAIVMVFIIVGDRKVFSGHIDELGGAQAEGGGVKAVQVE